MKTPDLADSVVRVVGPKGTVGAGFVVSTQHLLVATCAHVVEFAGFGPGDNIELVCHATGDRLVAFVEPAYWRPADDVAILRLQDALPEGVPSLQLGTSWGSRDHAFRTFGFPAALSEAGLAATGVITNRNRVGRARLQLSSASELAVGFSGAPLLDTAARRVVGMVVEILAPRAGRFFETAMGIPSETLIEICPNLVISDVCPYRDLRAFDEGDAEFFFGRVDAMDRMLHALRRDRRFLAVLGPSGSGKSSLVRAGLVPRLRAGDVENSDEWEIVIGRPAELDEIERRLPGAITDAIDLAVNAWLAKHPDRTRLVLVLDQFEEVFVELNAPARARLLAGLADAVHSTAPVTVMLIMRDEFYSRLVREAPALGSSLETGLSNIPPQLTRAELIGIVQSPATLLGLRFDEALVDRIVDDAIRDFPGRDAGTAATTALPPLELTLTHLWRGVRDGILTHDRYQHITGNGGGILGGIRRWAEEAWDRVNEPDRPLARHILTELVHLGDRSLGTPDSRRRRTVAELTRQDAEPGKIGTVVGRLATERLVVTMADDVELMHDALLREWQLLKGWLDDERDFRIWRQDVDRLRDVWNGTLSQDTFDNERLLRGPDLARAIGFRESHALNLTGDQRRFIDKSIEADKFARNAERRRTRRFRRLAGALAIVFLVACAVAVVAVQQRQVAIRAARVAAGQSLRSQAESVRNSQVGLSLRLSLAAMSVDPGPDARGTLVKTLISSHYVGELAGHPAGVSAAAFSRNGQIAATGDNDGTVILWDVTQRARPRRLATLDFGPNGHTGAVWAIAFSPVRAVLATGSPDSTTILWDVTDPARPRRLSTLRIDTTWVSSLAFSPDGRTLLAGMWDNSGRGSDRTNVWDVSDPTQPRAVSVLLDNGGPVLGVAISPDGRTAATGNNNGVVALWDLTDSARPHRLMMLPNPSNRARVVAFSPDKRLLAVGSADRTTKIWDVSDRERPRLRSTLTGHASTVRGIGFSPDAKTMVTASYDKTAILWRIDDPALPVRMDTLGGHTEPVTAADFSPDGHTILTASSDHLAILWDVVAPAFPIQAGQLIGHTGGVLAAEFSHRGDLMATGSRDGTAILWDVAQPTAARRLATLRGHRGGLGRVAFSPDDRILLTAGDDSTAVFWDIGHPNRPERLSVVGDGFRIASLGFSPDGRMVATGDDRGMVSLWDLADPRRPRQRAALKRHGAAVSAVLFSPTGQILLTASTDSTAILWDLRAPESPTPLQTLTDDFSIYEAAWSPNGRYLGLAEEGAKSTIWDLTNYSHPQRLATMRGQASSVYTIAISPSGQLVGTGGFDRVAILSDITDPHHPQELVSLAGQLDVVSAVRFSPNHDLIAISAENTVTLWDISALSEILARPVQVACAIVGRGLNPTEWRSYVNVPYHQTCA